MTAADLLAELRAAGVTVNPEIELEGPADALTNARIARVRQLKQELLRELVGDTTTITPREDSAIGGSGVGVTPATPDTADPGTGDAAAVDDGLFTAGELHLLAGSPPAVQQVVESVKLAFADVDALTVFEVVPSRSKARDTAARIIRETRRRDGCRARDLRVAWKKRLAVVPMHGEEPPAFAERVALEELEFLLAGKQG